MKIRQEQTIKLIFSELESLNPMNPFDPITVYLERHQLGKGKITIEHNGEAWSSYWPAMGKRHIEKFVCDCNAEYLISNLSRVSPVINDYESYLVVVKRKLFKRRRYQDLSKRESRNLYDALPKVFESSIDVEVHSNLLCEIFEDDQHAVFYAIPEKANPRYQFMLELIEVVQHGLSEWIASTEIIQTGKQS